MVAEKEREHYPRRGRVVGKENERGWGKVLLTKLIRQWDHNGERVRKSGRADECAKRSKQLRSVFAETISFMHGAA